MTEWERQTRNRVLRTLLETTKYSEGLLKKGRRIRDVPLIVAIANQAADRLEENARELRACVKDLGYGS